MQKPRLKGSIVSVILAVSMLATALMTSAPILAQESEPTAVLPEAPESEPTLQPTEEPTAEATVEIPTEEPTAEPTTEPTEEPTVEPTEELTPEATETPTAEPAPEEEFSWKYEADLLADARAGDAAGDLASLGLDASVRDLDGGSRLVVKGTLGVEEIRNFLNGAMATQFGLTGAPAQVDIELPVEEGKSIQVRLESNLSTGYRWEVEEGKSGGERMQRSISFDARQGIGVSYLQTVTFNPAASGTGTIRLVYRRPFEAEAAVTRRLTIQTTEALREFDLSSLAARSIAITETGATASADPFADLPLRGALPAALDWRTEGVVTSVKDQKSCGASWAFGTVAAMESAMLKIGGPATNLSEQFLISCNTDGWGCGGGLTAHKYHYDTLGLYQTAVGAVLESAKPYTATSGTCTLVTSHPYRLDGWLFVGGNETSVPTDEQLKTAIEAYGPVMAGVCAGGAFQEYESGVFSTNEDICRGSTNQKVLMVGWDDVGGYWIIKNSWGTDWGESGFMRIAYGTSRIGEGASWVATSAAAPGIPALDAPASGAFTNDSTPQLSWKKASYAATYDIQLSTSATFAVVVQDETGLTGLNHTFALPLADGKYYWRVRAVNSKGNGPWSAVWNFTVDTVAPATPVLISPLSGVTVTGTPTFKWQAAAGASRYEFEYNNVNDPDTFVYRSNKLGVLAHKPPAMLPNTLLYWYVRAFDAAGNYSAWSAFNTITVKPTVPPKVQLKTPTNNFTNDSTPTLEWKEAAYGATYHIQISDTYKFKTILEEQDGLWLTFTTAHLADGRYYWRVRARNVDGAYGPWSGYRYFTVDTVNPTVPVLLSPVNGANRVGTPNFSWKASTGAKFYQFGYNTSGDPADPFVHLSGENITRLYYKPPAMTIMTQYYWLVRAKDAAGNWSNWSAPFAIKIIPPPPARVELTSPIDGYGTLAYSFTVSWKAATNGHTYQIEVDDSSTFNSAEYSYTSAAGATSMLIGPMTAGKWYWRVRGLNINSDPGPWSASRSFTIHPNFNTQFNTADDFEGWVEHAGGTWAVSSNTLNTAGVAGGVTSSASFGGVKFKNFSYEARIKMNAPASETSNVYGLILRGTPEFDSMNDWIKGYYFAIQQIHPASGTQYACANVFRIWNGTWTQLGSWWCSSSIDYADYNVLKVYMNGSTLRFYVNDALIKSKTFSSPGGGSLGVFSWGDGETTYVDWAVAGLPELPTSTASIRTADGFIPENLEDAKFQRSVPE